MRISILALFLALLFQAPLANAAFKSSSDAISPESAWNPVPLANDITLPMPCGVAMVMRPVEISTPALIADKDFTMGITNAVEDERQLYEKKFSGHIAAPFTAQTLPDNWKKNMDVSGGGGSKQPTWYFIGKYEVSRLQWEAVMESLNADGDEDTQACPAKTARGLNVPVTGISWLQAQDFLGRYNAWLIKNHPEALPAFPGTRNIAYLRLPTEEEWEYAARGGMQVAPEWWQSQDFFPTQDNKTMQDYAVYNHGANLEAPLPIGSRNPNPLGLFDTAGNVKEMVDGFFRMSIAYKNNGLTERRLHGASGGILTKGGSFRSSETQILPGSREEMALYSVGGPVKQTDTGIRLVLAGINMAGGDRMRILQAQEKEPAYSGENKKPALVLDDNMSIIDSINTLAAASEGEMKQGLLKLKSQIEDQQQAQSMQDSKSLELAFRSLVYQAETLRAFAFRYWETNSIARQLKGVLAEKLSPADREMAQKSYDRAKANLDSFMQSLEMGANYYKTSIEAIAADTRGELARLADMTKHEYTGNDVFNKHMRDNISIAEKFIKLAQEGKLSTLGPRTILKDILPAEHFRELPLKKTS